MLRILVQKFLTFTKGVIATTSKAKQIALLVFLSHCIVLLGLSIHHLATNRSLPKRPISVRTQNFSEIKQVLKPEKPANCIVQSFSKPSQNLTQKQTLKSARKIQSTHPVDKIPKSTKKTNAVSDSAYLFEEIAEKLDALSSRKQPTHCKKNLLVPSEVPIRVEEANTSPIDPRYSDHLILFLQNALDLPEHGEVKALIEIDRYGNLIDCIILDSKSRKNSDFLKNRLPDLAFPCFNDFEIIDATLKFTLTFRNVEIR